MKQTTIHSKKMHLLLSTELLIDNPGVIDDIVRKASEKNSDIKKLMQGKKSFVQEYLMLKPREFRDIVAEAALKGRPSKLFLAANARNIAIVVDDNGLNIYTAQAGIISVSVTEKELRRYPCNTEASNLRPSVLAHVCNGLLEAMAENKSYIYDEEQPYPRWLDLVSTERNSRNRILNEIAFIMFAPMKELVKSTGFSQRRLADDMMISRRTMEDWCSGAREAKIYNRIAIARYVWMYTGET